MVARQVGPGPPGPRVVICDYNPASQSVTSLLRLDGFHVFQAWDGQAAEELCRYVRNVRLLVLNAEGTAVDVVGLVHRVRAEFADLPVLHIGNDVPTGLPADVRSLSPRYSVEGLLTTAEWLIERRHRRIMPVEN